MVTMKPIYVHAFICYILPAFHKNILRIDHMMTPLPDPLDAEKLCRAGAVPQPRVETRTELHTQNRSCCFEDISARIPSLNDAGASSSH
ncbi:hypothetical protein ILYODFUR_011553 [Ilyodon furcidens]|uniref:Uncharacterized protein n=1 Tax=Ilyodon furcidens TaxID=33524 RepID=A0ABV0T761_9TELE